jgi:hypothetical protein
MALDYGGEIEQGFGVLGAVCGKGDEEQRVCSGE